MTHMLLCHGGILASKSMSILQQFSSYWSATVHDYEHGGLNNDLLCKTAHPLAMLYNDISPLENHHVSAAASLHMQPECAYIEVCFQLSLAVSPLSPLAHFLIPSPSAPPIARLSMQGPSALLHLPVPACVHQIDTCISYSSPAHAVR